MKKRALNLLFVSILTALLAVILSACGLFNYKKDLGVTSIGVVSGLSETEEGYVAQLGDTFTLAAEWTKNKDAIPKIEWFISENEGDPVKCEEASGKKFNYVFTEITDSVFTFSAKINDKEVGNSATVSVTYATLKQIEITSDTHEIKQNTVLQKLDEIAPLSLFANWNAEYFEPGYEESLTFNWFINGAEIKNAVLREFVYIPSIDDKNLVISIKAYFDGEECASGSVNFSVITVYEQVGEVTVSVIKGADKQEKGYYTQFITVAGGSANSAVITLEASVSPMKANVYAPVVWSRRSESGTEILSTCNKKTEVDLKPGKNVFTATVENVESKQLTVYSCAESQYNSFKAIADDTFIWWGDVYSFYILDGQDLIAAINHLAANRITAVSMFDQNARSIYFQPFSWKEGIYPTEKLKKEILNALNNIDSSGSFDIEYNTAKIYFSNSTVFGGAKETNPNAVRVAQANFVTHFSNSDTVRTKLPIDDAADSMFVENSDQLFRAVGYGYRPLFKDDANGNKLKNLYNEARNVMLRIADDTMTEYEKVHAIYEWIIKNVSYDEESANDKESNLGTLLGFNAFYLEGVFNDGIAVCDGKSKAFTLMCGLENIRSIRIIGKASASADKPLYEMDEEDLKSVGGHAWNKVLVDTDGDGVREWYIIDTTWGDLGIGATEYASASYFLIKDEDIKATHYSTRPQRPADTDFDYYAITSIDVGGENVGLYVSDVASLKKLLIYSKQQNGIFINLKNAMPNPSPNQFLLLVRKLTEELGGTYSFIDLGEEQYLVCLSK